MELIRWKLISNNMRLYKRIFVLPINLSSSMSSSSVLLKIYIYIYIYNCAIKGRLRSRPSTYRAGADSLSLHSTIYLTIFFTMTKMKTVFFTWKNKYPYPSLKMWHGLALKSIGDRPFYFLLFRGGPYIFRIGKRKIILVTLIKTTKWAYKHT